MVSKAKILSNTHTQHQEFQVVPALQGFSNMHGFALQYQMKTLLHENPNHQIDIVSSGVNSRKHLIIRSRTNSENAVSCCLRFVGHNGQFLTNQLIQKCALSYIWLPHQRNVTCNLVRMFSHSDLSTRFEYRKISAMTRTLESPFVTRIPEKFHSKWSQRGCGHTCALICEAKFSVKSQRDCEQIPLEIFGTVVNVKQRDCEQICEFCCLYIFRGLFMYLDF